MSIKFDVTRFPSKCISTLFIFYLKTSITFLTALIHLRTRPPPRRELCRLRIIQLKTRKIRHVSGTSNRTYVITEHVISEKFHFQGHHNIRGWFCVKWIPNILTEIHKKQRLAAALTFPEDMYYYTLLQIPCKITNSPKSYNFRSLVSILPW